MARRTFHPDLFGLLIECAGPDELVDAARKVHSAGYRRVEAYSPMPIHGLAEAVGMRKTRLPWLVLSGGIIGGVLGFLFQCWVSAVAYPHNVGGRPHISWPSFIPVTFETTILTASLVGVLGMLALNGLPRPHHPLFAIPDFARASQSGFFLCIISDDPIFDVEQAKLLLAPLAIGEVMEVPHTDT